MPEHKNELCFEFSKYWPYSSLSEDEKTVSASAERQAWEKWFLNRLFGLYLPLCGKRLSTHIRNKCGMNFVHDVRDWIWGYHYESIRSKEIVVQLAPLGLCLEHGTIKRRPGLSDSGCDECVYRCASPS